MDRFRTHVSSTRLRIVARSPGVEERFLSALAGRPPLRPDRGRPCAGQARAQLPRGNRDGFRSRPIALGSRLGMGLRASHGFALKRSCHLPPANRPTAVRAGAAVETTSSLW